MAPRFLIDENLTPMLAEHLRSVHGYDAIHVLDAGLRGASDADVLARAVADDRVIITGNAADFRALARGSPGHPGLAILLETAGRTRQILLGEMLAAAIDGAGSAHGQVFEIDRLGSITRGALP